MRSLLTILIFISSSLAAAQSAKPSALVSSKEPFVILGQSVTGQLTYFIPGPSGQLKEVSLSFFTDSLEKAIANAKKVVCDMSVLPQSVTISSVVVSVTYDTKQFCPKKL